MNNPDNKCLIPNPLESDSEFQMTMMNPNPSFQTHKDGDKYFIKWEYSKEEWEWFTDPNINRTGMVVESGVRVTHRNQKKGPNLGAPKIVVLSCGSNDIKQKTWKLSQEAGKLCSDPNFQSFLRVSVAEEWNSIAVGLGIEEPQLIAAQMIRNICAIESRKSLETNAEARRRFMNIMHEFSVWSLETA